MSKTQTEILLHNRTRVLEDLAAQATSGQIGAENLGIIVRDLARIEGRLQVAHLQDQIEDKDELVRAVTGLLLNSPDDEWSGRGNDNRRARNDGLREQACKVIRGF